jgi:trans-aconitate 2-methyltransferase
MYKWDAKEYHQHSSAQKAWAQELIDKLALKGDECFLDIGCGDGAVTASVAALLTRGRATGIDSSAEMVGFAQKNFPPSMRKNLSFALMDARDLKFDSEFDVVFSSAVLHWMLDHRPILAGINRSLKPGGRILLQMGGRGNAAKIIAVIDRIKSDPRWADGFKDFKFPYGFYGPEEYRGWLTEAGLKPVRVELVPKQMTQQGREGLMGWVRTTWLPFISVVPDAHKEEFIAEVVDRYIAENPLDSSGLVTVGMVRLEVEAVKA